MLVYNDTTLAREGVASGWRDVLALGVSADLLDHLRPTGDTAEIAGAALRTVRAATRPMAVDVWWSDELFVVGADDPACWRRRRYPGTHRHRGRGGPFGP